MAKFGLFNFFGPGNPGVGVGQLVLQGVEQQRCKILSNPTLFGVGDGVRSLLTYWHCSRVIEIFESFCCNHIV